MPRSATATPVPDNATIRVPPSLATVRVPVAGPSAVGAKETSMTHMFPGATWPALEQPSELTWNGPLAVTEVTVSALEPVLVTMTGCGALVVPIPSEPKETADGPTAMPGLVPLPVRVSCCGPSPESFGKVNVAERAPAAAGVNVISRVHEPPAGIKGPMPSLGQVKPGPRTKSPGSGPPVAGGPVRCVGSVPEFVNVIVRTLDWPTRTPPKFIGFGDSDRRLLSPVPARLIWSGLLRAS